VPLPQRPVGDVVNEVLFKHETPLLNSVQQTKAERSGINPEPPLKDHGSLNRFHLLIDRLIRIDLQHQSTETLQQIHKEIHLFVMNLYIIYHYLLAI